MLRMFSRFDMMRENSALIPGRSVEAGFGSSKIAPSVVVLGSSSVLSRRKADAVSSVPSEGIRIRAVRPSFKIAA